MIMSRIHPILLLLALLCGNCLLTRQAHAQFQSNVTLNKATYMIYEGVEATVTINNRSGADVVMGGPGGSSWLAFNVTDPTGRQMPVVNVSSKEPIIFKSGATISRTINLTQHFSFSNHGNYFVAATIYHPPTQQYYESNRARASFSGSSPFWKQSFGVPSGLPGAGQVRRYALATMRDMDRMYLYMRLMDDRSEANISTMSLGSCIMVTDPQVTLDRENKLHVLFMTVPRTYAHIVVDTQGRIYRRNYHKETDDDRPQMVAQADGSVMVSGGHPYDPAVEAEQQKASRGRSIGEKPPGL